MLLQKCPPEVIACLHWVSAIGWVRTIAVASGRLPAAASDCGRHRGAEEKTIRQRSLRLAISIWENRENTETDRDTEPIINRSQQINRVIKVLQPAQSHRINPKSQYNYHHSNHIFHPFHRQFPDLKHFLKFPAWKKHKKFSRFPLISRLAENPINAPGLAARFSYSW